MHTRFRIAFMVGSLLALGACSGGSSSGGIGDGEIPGKGAGADADGADPAGPSGAVGTGGPSEGGDLGGDGPPASGGVGTGSGGGGGAGGGGTGVGGTGGGGTGGGGSVEPGTLTAGVWDDNRNFDFFLAYRSTLHGQQLPGVLPFTEADHRAAHSLFAAPPGRRETLDVSLIIDTTGSMGDEITYLQTEFIALSDSIFAKYPNAEQRWSLVLYRDTEDDYVVRWFDFRADPDEFQEKLAEQAADGGGDFPEAPDVALSKAADLSWRTGGDTARLAFWVADAPHHDSNAGAMAEGIRALKDSGVAVYPVASSGVDELTEFSMRSAAQLTGGRYLFLTNDSGVGGDHKEPTIPCYYVTKLDRAILRMVDVALSGVYREPEPSEILRTGGDPLDGACELSSGGEVLAY
ncbi:vWA domain-containing protein [Sorangium sp. So ce1078]|uniref:vWA domain-containing protein n=1 Tax=Sorangium sp. So ce1078 TaxID=3133329 RepID=UPI003F6293B8